MESLPRQRFAPTEGYRQIAILGLWPFRRGPARLADRVAAVAALQLRPAHSHNH